MWTTRGKCGKKLSCTDILHGVRHHPFLWLAAMMFSSSPSPEPNPSFSPGSTFMHSQVHGIVNFLNRHNEFLNLIGTIDVHFTLLVYNRVILCLRCNGKIQLIIKCSNIHNYWSGILMIRQSVFMTFVQKKNLLSFIIWSFNAWTENKVVTQT